MGSGLTRPDAFDETEDPPAEYTGDLTAIEMHHWLDIIPNSAWTDDTDLDAYKHVTFVREDCMKNSQDSLRQLLGLYWEKGVDPENLEPFIEYKENYLYSKFAIEEYSDLNSVTVKRLSCASPYIEFVEFNPAWAEVSQGDSYMHNIKIPLRLYASEENTKGDYFWNILLNGGPFGPDTYPSITSADFLFYDESFRISLPYSKQEGTIYTPIQVTCEYKSYNENVRKYQEYVKDLESELLIPNSQIYANTTYYPWLDISEAGGLLGSQAWYRQFGSAYLDYLCYPFEKIISKSLDRYDADDGHFDASDVYEWLQSDFEDVDGSSVIDAVLDAISGARETEAVYGTESSSDLLSTSKKAIYDYVYNYIHNYYAFDSNPTTAQRLLFEKYLASLRDFDAGMPQSIKQKAIDKQRNIIYVDSSKYMSDVTRNWNIKTAEGLFPYCIKVDIPTMPTADYDGRTRIFRNMIEAHGSGAKIMESLKDIHHGDFPNLSMQPQRFHTYTKMFAGGSDTATKSYKMIDFVELLSEVYNQPSAALNPDNYTFIGSAIEEYLTTMGDSGVFRYADSQNIISTLDLIALMSEQILSVLNPTGITTDSINETLLTNVLQPKLRYNEILAYRIEKIGGIQQGDETTSNVIQDIWIYADDTGQVHAPPYRWVDNQVKYGQNYTYNISAYVFVIGFKYKYSDFRLTKQTAILGGTGDDPDLYCMQFYDASSQEYTDQLFSHTITTEATADEYFRATAARAHSTEAMTSATLGDADTERTEASIESLGVEALGDIRWKSIAPLSIRNEFSTDEQGLSRYPQLADLYYHIEPCVKLVEIPIYSKTLKVTDHPASDITAAPFQFIDSSQRIGFETKYQSYQENRYPSTISTADRNLQSEYLHAMDLSTSDMIINKSLSPPRYLEVYRAEKKPTALSDFEGKRIKTIDLKIPESDMTHADAIVVQKIATNKKYYYILRFLNENKMPGHLSQIIEAELVDDGGYIYSSFNILSEEEFDQDVYSKPSINFKKLLQLQPNLRQLELDTTNADFSRAATAEKDKVQVGAHTGAGSIWDQTFKLRLTSKKTGKKADLNVTFKIKQEDKYST
jgi:hypothetical protein